MRRHHLLELKLLKNNKYYNVINKISLTNFIKVYRYKNSNSFLMLPKLHSRMITNCIKKFHDIMVVVVKYLRSNPFHFAGNDVLNV
jgi:hypothetical protein